MHESKWVRAGYQHIFGLDEVGRGPMAGPLVAAAVCLPLNDPELHIKLMGVKDSKQMTERQRIRAIEAIKSVALAWGIGQVTAQEMGEIDNMVQVTLLAMERALAAAQEQHNLQADFLLVDYYNVPFFDLEKQEALAKGDTLSLSIAAASVVAKVHRDQLMIDYAQQWPEYGFERHKGYPTAAHKAALEQHGVTPIHRPNYAPVKNVLSTQDS